MLLTMLKILRPQMKYAATTEYDLILLDIMLPDGDGRDFLASRGAKTLKRR